MVLTAENYYSQEANEEYMSVSQFKDFCGKDASEGDGTTFTVNNAQQNDGGGKVEVNVNMNPVIKIEGSNMDEEKIFQVLQNRIREMADDLGDEIAERMGKIFNNMPAVQEA